MGLRSCYLKIHVVVVRSNIGEAGDATDPTALIAVPICLFAITTGHRRVRVCINIAEETFEPAFIDERIALKIEEDVAGGRFWQTGKPEAQGHRQELVENFPDLTSIDLQPSLLADLLIGNSQCVMSDPASAVISCLPSAYSRPSSSPSRRSWRQGQKR